MKKQDIQDKRLYQELFSKEKSIHLTKIEQLEYDFEDEINTGDIIIEIISKIRGEKSNNNLSLKTEVKLLDLSLNKNLIEAINSMIQDFKATLFIDELVLNEIEENYLINKIELNV